MRKWIPYILTLLLLIGMISQQYYITSVEENFNTLIEKTENLQKLITKIGSDLIDLIPYIESKPDFKKLKLATIQIKVGKAGGAGITYKIDKKYLYVLTVKHALRQKGNIEMWIYNDKQKIVSVKNISRENTYISKEVDLALVKVPIPEGNFIIIPLAEKQPNIGDKIYTIGHPLLFYYSINIGLVTNYVKRTHRNVKGDYMVISAPSYRGNSGGAVVNTNNELVGIVSGIMYLEKGLFFTEIDKLHNISFVIRLEDIKRFLEKIE